MKICLFRNKLSKRKNEAFFKIPQIKKNNNKNEAPQGRDSVLCYILSVQNKAWHIVGAQ